MNQLQEPRPVPYDQIVRNLGLAAKQVQKALSDLCKYGFVSKVEKGYVALTPREVNHGQETIA